MNNATQTAPADLISSSRGMGRLFARTTVGRGPSVLAAALRKARASMPACDADAFVAGFQAERRDMRAPEGPCGCVFGCIICRRGLGWMTSAR